METHGANRSCGLQLHADYALAGSVLPSSGEWAQWRLSILCPPPIVTDVYMKWCRAAAHCNNSIRKASNLPHRMLHGRPMNVAWCGHRRPACRKLCFYKYL